MDDMKPRDPRTPAEKQMWKDASEKIAWEAFQAFCANRDRRDRDRRVRTDAEVQQEIDIRKATTGPRRDTEA